MKAKHSNNLAFISILMVAALALSALSPATAQSHKQRPFNRIVVLLDQSGSFESKLPEAREIAWKYLRNLANTSPDDEAYIIGVDHSPYIPHILHTYSRTPPDSPRCTIPHILCAYSAYHCVHFAHTMPAQARSRRHSRAQPVPHYSISRHFSQHWRRSAHRVTSCQC